MNAAFYFSFPARLFALLVFSSSFSAFAGGESQLSEGRFEIINPENIQIVRDQWGVPHIFGNTDAEVAYGYAWAIGEDMFAVMQELLMAGKGMAARYMGAEGAKRDFMSHVLGSEELVKEKYETALSEDFKKYLNGYVQGINAYARQHADEILVRKAFPVTSYDVLRSFIFAQSAVSGAIGPISRAVDGKYDLQEVPMGSNAFAFNSNKTTDGSSILLINPHQPVEGPFSWYEAHLCSQEGMNIHGASFPGGTSIFLGSNENLGWAHTFNDMDLVDVFKLEMHPKKKSYYKFDGEWLKLEKRPVTLKVKVKKWLPLIPVRMVTYWSKYGTTVKSKNKKNKSFYSIKLPANEEIRSPEQIYRMNKARNFTEFSNAIHMHATPRYNIIYADRYDTIMYCNYAKVPLRNQGYEWNKVVPGNTSKTLWTETHPLDFMPTYINPECGYVFNTNNDPFNATCAENNNLDKSKYPTYMGFEPGNNSRAFRFMELIGQYHKVSLDDVKRIKFDKKYPGCGTFIESVDYLSYLDPNEYPDISELLVMMRKWDRSVDKSSENATIFLLTFQYIFDKLHVSNETFVRALDVPKDLYIEAVRNTKNHLMKYYGKLNVSLGEVQRHVRGSVNIPLSGFPDALSANYNEPYENGRYKPYVADSYVQFVQYKKDGSMVLETLHPFGASAKPNSKHYTDQMEIYANQQTKKMTLNREDIFKNAEKIYHPK